jgi:DNA repair exonuclease SbcCD ATPase subunit
VRIRVVLAAALGVALAGLNSFIGCATAPTVCGVSPIDIEEVKSDSRDRQEELAEFQQRLTVAQEDLARWEARLAEREAEKPELRAELERLKKMSGVTEKIDIDVKPKRPTEQPNELDVDVRN